MCRVAEKKKEKGGLIVLRPDSGDPVEQASAFRKSYVENCIHFTSSSVWFVCVSGVIGFV